MLFLAHTAHLQLAGLLSGCLAWILTMAATATDQWRLWRLRRSNDTAHITSGVAWVGIWRACFHSHALPEMEHCQSVSFSDAFVPPEIRAAQVSMMLAAATALAANAAAGQAVRRVYFSLEVRGRVRALFILAGALYVLAGALAAVPLAWNAKAVADGAAIHFPPSFRLPATPAGQEVGVAIVLGWVAAILMFTNGLVFLAHRHVWRRLPTEKMEDKPGTDNPAFQ
ncbi:claudin-34 [Stigmatopora nigra]